MSHTIDFHVAKTSHLTSQTTPIHIRNIEDIYKLSEPSLNQIVSRSFKVLYWTSYIETKKIFKDKDPEKTIKEFNENVKELLKAEGTIMSEATERAAIIKTIRNLNSSGRASVKSVREEAKGYTRAIEGMLEDLNYLVESRKATRSLVEGINNVAKNTKATIKSSKGAISSAQGDIYEAFLARVLNPGLTSAEDIQKIMAGTKGSKSDFGIQNGGVTVGVTLKAYFSDSPTYKAGDKMSTSSETFLSIRDELNQLGYVAKTGDKNTTSYFAKKLIGVALADIAIAGFDKTKALYSINLRQQGEQIVANAEFIYEKYKEYSNRAATGGGTVIAAISGGNLNDSTKTLSNFKASVYAFF